MFRHQEQNLYKSFKFLPFDSDIYLPLGLGYEGHIKLYLISTIYVDSYNCASAKLPFDVHRSILSQTLFMNHKLKWILKDLLTVK